MAHTFSIALHGGAGTIVKSKMTDSLQQSYQDALRQSIQAGYEILKNGGGATDAVVAAVMIMEDFPLFNAGKGSVFNSVGKHEMDAAVMNGEFLKAGAVAGVSGIKNPIQLAQKVMDESEHVLLMGEGAATFAREKGFAFQSDDYFFEESRFAQFQEAKKNNRVQLDHHNNKFGTVGAVALDQQGNLAAATSTGGMTNKMYGRMGDSPIIGAGTYANNKTCAISCTGHGELFLRSVVAYDISCLMEYKNLSLQQASEIVVMDKLVKIGGEGGLVAVDGQGNIAMPFNSEGMYRAYKKSTGDEKVLIYKIE